MKVTAKLTQKQVDQILARPTDGRHMLADGRGLALAVYPDSGGRTRASFVLQARTRSGKPVRIGLGSAEVVKLEAARAKADEHRETLKAGRNPVEEKRAARVVAQEADASTLERYIRHTYGPHLVDTNHRSAADSTRRILADWKSLLQIPVAQITGEMICKVLRDQKARNDEDGDPLLSPATLRRGWATFRPALVYARDVAHLIQRLPIEGTPEPLRGLKEEPSRCYLGKDDPTETKRFLDALAAFTSSKPGGGEFLRVACALALNCGLRRGEIVQLKDSMIQMGVAGREQIELPKEICKGKRGRIVPMNADAVAAVKRWQETRKTLPVQSIDGSLFPGKAERWEDRLTQREFPRLCAEAGLPDDEITFKTLRATYASLHVQGGTPIQIVCQWLGHSSVLITERHYAYLKPNTGQELARAFKVS